MAWPSNWRLDLRTFGSRIFGGSYLPFSLALVLFCSGCVTSTRYNSLDLALLPCETGDSPVFFKAIEFDENGAPQHAQQIDELRQRFKNGPPVTDVVLFVHGWNKNPSSAELDYQNFLCRLHGRLRSAIGVQKQAGGLIVLGVFWPSTITNRSEEPWLLKPISYYRVRERADHIAEVGLSRLLNEMAPTVKSQKLFVSPKMHLIGHSFGGRMVIRSLETLQRQGELISFLTAFDSTNVVLINAATPATRLDWIQKAIATSRQQKVSPRFTQDTASFLFNLHSFNDSANRYLFPLASLLNDDPASCAAGACGVPNYPTVCADMSGRLRVDQSIPLTPEQLNDRINAWNVDVTPIVFEHSDIYKGRIATLIANLLYDSKTKQLLPAGHQGQGEATNARCQFEKTTR